MLPTGNREVSCPMRVLALSNEAQPGADPDVPWALGRLLHDGLIDAYRVYSTRTHVATKGCTLAASELACEISEFEADTVIFFNTGSCLFNEAGLDEMRRARPDAVWVYYEGDAFQRWVLPYPRRALPTVRRCDIAFAFCGGHLARVLRRAGCPRVDYAPSWVNTERFPRVWKSSGSFTYDVAFVGNNTRSRVRPFPGARDRRRLMASLQRRYGTRFALAGSGWTGVGVLGPCRLDDVSQLYAASKVCVSIDHVVAPYQFSNRLPIALSSGIPVVHRVFPGSQEVLPGFPTAQYFVSVKEAIRNIDRLLEMDAQELDALSHAQQTIAETLSCDRVLRYMLQSAKAVREPDERTPVNPWLRHQVDDWAALQG